MRYPHGTSPPDTRCLAHFSTSLSPNNLRGDHRLRLRRLVELMGGRLVQYCAAGSCTAAESAVTRGTLPESDDIGDPY
eukprot:7382662-Prymnesium_polylepis.1